MEYVIGVVVVLGLVFFVMHKKSQSLHNACSQMTVITFPEWLNAYYSSSGSKKIFMARSFIYQSAELAHSSGILTDSEKYILQENSEKNDPVAMLGFFLGNPLSFLHEKLGNEAFDTVQARFAGLFMYGIVYPTDSPEENYNILMSKLDGTDRSTPILHDAISFLRKSGYID